MDWAIYNGESSFKNNALKPDSDDEVNSLFKENSFKNYLYKLNVFRLLNNNNDILLLL